MTFATRVARWSSRVMFVGLVTLLLARCGGGSDSGSGPTQPSISLSDQTIAFAGIEGGADPSPQTVAVANVGTGALVGLSTSVSYATTPDGWLVGELSTSDAPSTITLIATTGSLTAGTYEATVAVAASSADNSPRLIEVTFTVGSNTPTVPATPTSLAGIAVSSVQINLTWIDNATNESGYSVQRCAGAGCGAFVEVATTDPDAVSYPDLGLSASTTYRYRVRAYNDVGSSGNSNIVTATTLAPAATPPAAPSSLAATAVSSSQVNLSWTDNASNEQGFLIERCTGSSCTNFVEFGSTTTNVVTYENTALSASTVYTYRVRAWNSTGTSAFSNISAATTLAPAVVPPSAPTGLVATTVSTSQITLGWTDNATTETGFRIEQCAGSGCTNFVELGTAPANATAANITGLTQGTIYRYQVRAYNTGGNSAYSNIAQGTTESSAFFPASFDNLVMKNSANSAIQNTVFSGSGVENAVGYKYYYTGSALTNQISAASLLKFDVQTQIAGRTVLEAQLLMQEYYAPGDLNGTFKVAAIGSAWNPSTMTWTAFETTTYYGLHSVNFTALSTNSVSARSFDVTAIVQNWASGAWTNNGLVIFDEAPMAPGFESYQILGFESLELYTNVSRRPQLYIRYR